MKQVLDKNIVLQIPYSKEKREAMAINCEHFGRNYSSHV